MFVLLGDGEMQEGQVWEAALSAAHHRPRKLIAIVDRNGFQLDGKVDDVIGVEPLDEKWRAFGWEVHAVDGHDVAALTEVLRRVKAERSRERPACIIAQTIKGKGVSYMETEPGWHLGYLAPEDASAPSPRSKRRRLRDERPPFPQLLAVPQLNALNAGFVVPLGCADRAGQRGPSGRRRHRRPAVFERARSIRESVSGALHPVRHFRAEHGLGGGRAWPPAG